LIKIAVPMSMEYEQFMRQLQENEDGEPLGKEILEINSKLYYYFCFISISKFH
jgi:hypothetical protein